MDWVWTDTTLSLSNWICVEDIYANIFILKCWRESEKVTVTLAQSKAQFILHTSFIKNSSDYQLNMSVLYQVRLLYSFLKNK